MFYNGAENRVTSEVKVNDGKEHTFLMRKREAKIYFRVSFLYVDRSNKEPAPHAPCPV
jgi:hypothetical protein